MIVNQITDTLLMVRPAYFGFNPQTASSNFFQENDTSLTPHEIHILALQEFDQFVAVLRAAGVQVIVMEDTKDPVKYDAIFPNNWISTHQDGTIITYPMHSPMRRQERQPFIISHLMEEFGFKKLLALNLLDNLEAEEIYLEGTGSLLLDRPNKIVYACSSPRTHTIGIDKFCEITGFQPILFQAHDKNHELIYHTNVMMALGETLVIICLESLQNPQELAQVRTSFEQTQKEVIEISMEQMFSFAGNMLQVRSKNGESYLVMSEQAYRALRSDQIERIEKHTSILYSPLYTIEKFGGGSARCMLAEIFVPNSVE